MATKIQLRRGTAAEWVAASSVSPAVVLSAGEVGFETDTGKFKIGNGQSYWGQLSYASVLPSEINSLISAHNNDTTNVHGIANMEDLATQNYVDQAISSLGNTVDGSYVPISEVGNPDGIATLDVNGQVPVSQLGNIIDGAPSLLNTLNELAAAIGDDANFAAVVANKQDKVSGVSDTEIGYLDGVTSNIQNQINSISSVSNATTSVAGKVLGLTTGDQNGGVTALGSRAGGSNISSSNTAIGNATLYNIPSSAQGNTAVGYQSMLGHSGSFTQHNTAIGNQALYGSPFSNSNAEHNTAIGSGSLYYNVSGDSNTSIGSASGFSLTSGSNNTLIGREAGSAIETGSNNTVIGSLAQPSYSNISNEITLGNYDITQFRVPGIGMNWYSDGSTFLNMQTEFNLGLVSLEGIDLEVAQSKSIKIKTPYGQDTQNVVEFSGDGIKLRPYGPYNSTSSTTIGTGYYGGLAMITDGMISVSTPASNSGFDGGGFRIFSEDPNNSNNTLSVGLHAGYSSGSKAGFVTSYYDPLILRGTDSPAVGFGVYIGSFNPANKVATYSYVDTQVSNLVNSAPSTLNTLKELSDALAADPNFATTITNLIGTKIATSQKGVANGVASLDAYGQVPSNQLGNAGGGGIHAFAMIG